MFTDLEKLRDALADIDGVCSCKIGIESGISPSDYPLIRLVPVRMTPGAPYQNRTIELGIYFGWDTSNADGLEKVYKDVLAMEGEIIKTIKAQGGRYVETITDEDRLEPYKLMFIRAEMTAERPAVTA